MKMASIRVLSNGSVRCYVYLEYFHTRVRVPDDDLETNDRKRDRIVTKSRSAWLDTG